MKEPLFIVVDLFCGAGGTTTGFVHAEINSDYYSKYYVGENFAKEGFTKIAKVIACVNHDPVAIKSHWVNHPEVKHFEEDIRTLELSELVKLVNYYRKLYPNAKVVLWASLECTNFSKAKGGQSRDADSRTLAESLLKKWDAGKNKYVKGDSYIQLLNPDYVMIENVVEFKVWGPLRIKAKACYENYTELATQINKKTKELSYKWIPIEKLKGIDFNRWCDTVKSLGFENEWRELNSADFGAYTSRNRLFGLFAKPGLPIIFPEPTHAKKRKSKKQQSLFSTELSQWKAVRDVLDFTNKGVSILYRKKPLCDRTLERLYAGLIKFVAKGDTSFISKYFSGKPMGKNISLDGPAGTIKTIDGQAIVQTEFLIQRNSGNPKSKIIDIDGPARTITGTGGNQDLVQPEFLTHYYIHGFNSSPEDPLPTIRTKDSASLIQPKFFIDKQYTGYKNNQSIEVPAGSIMPNDKHALVRCDGFIFNSGHGGHNTAIDQPCPVIVARQDKAPLRIIHAERGKNVSVAVYENDTEIMIKIKIFMVHFQIVDIYMRLLVIHELLKIQGFPDGYELKGTQTDQKKFIGNSVVPKLPKVWAEALAISLIQLTKKAA